MIGAIEQKIIDRLDAARDAGVLGYPLKVGSYGGELDDDLSLITNKFPASWVVFKAEDKPIQVARGVARVKARFTVMVGQKNRRNEEARRRGAAGSVGSYQIAKDVQALLFGQKLGLDIERIEPAGIRSIFNGKHRNKQLSLFAVDFQTGYEIEVPEPAGGLDDFATFHNDWDIPVFLDPQPPVPLDPDEADATDEVELETS